jgi:hypothetical protein
MIRPTDPRGLLLAERTGPPPPGPATIPLGEAAAAGEAATQGALFT